MKLNEYLEMKWHELGDQPVDFDAQDRLVLDVSWEGWQRGTDVEVIWHVFDELCPNGLVEDLMPWSI